MTAEHPDLAVSKIAAAIGEPARARILYCLLDGHARTATELAAVADVSPSTTSVHLQRLRSEHLIKVFIQGKHHYYSLQGEQVAEALEALSVIAGQRSSAFVPNTPSRLLQARTCYDHMAGKLGVSLHNHFRKMKWLSGASNGDNAYEVTGDGMKGFGGLGVDVEGARKTRRRFAYACLDWSERQPHIGGALGAALLQTALKKRWVSQDLDSRALAITGLGRREIQSRIGLLL